MPLTGVGAWIGCGWGRGGLSALWFYGSEADLAAVDACFRPSGRGAWQPTVGALSHGVLHLHEGRLVDEVLLSVPRRGTRLLSGHGGDSSIQALAAFARSLGVTLLEQPPTSPFSSGEAIVEEADALLPLCRTEWQMSLLLCARAELPHRILACLHAEDASACLQQLAAGYAQARATLADHRLILAGAPNVGKSSLLNRIVGAERMVTSDEAGTTRDTVEEWADVGGWSLRLVDGAGLRDCGEDLEAQSQARLVETLRHSDGVILVLDGSRAWSAEDQTALGLVAESVRGVVINKADRPRALSETEVQRHLSSVPCVTLSCHEDGVRGRLESLLDSFLPSRWSGEAVPFTDRQASLLARLAEAARLDDGGEAETLMTELLGEAGAAKTFDF